ncbi:CHAT domain-containing protein [Streptomyces sp. NPDC056549]|uniref:CHAT domain-containing protein n=1 Tax=Streptomyces sp. NPDC056549 TaxID=3345864 RepID=UPI0036980AA2
MSDVNFEFGLAWKKSQDAFDINLRYSDSSSADWPRHPSVPLTIDLAELAQHLGDAHTYGQTLTDMVFGQSDETASFFEKAIAAARDSTVHFRIHLDGPARYHSVRWELLHTPGGAHPIATSSNILLSRYLANADWNPLPPRPVHDTRALVVIASPNNLNEFAPGPQGKPLAPIDVEQEMQHAWKALQPYRCQTLAGPEARPTVDRIMRRIDDYFEGGFDILYVVCHGTMYHDRPIIFLESPDGAADPVDAVQLADRIRGLERKPTLAILISCQSAGDDAEFPGVDGEMRSDDNGVLAALGPRLASAGVGAVVAMQGNITKTSADTFTPTFFKRFAEDLAVDRAMATARNAIKDRPDWWVPVLFSRLRSGQAYHCLKPTGDLRKTWTSLETMARSGRFTPILGPGLADGILGSRQEIARRWVRRWQMPIAPHGQGNLAQVAQYLRVSYSQNLVSAYLEDYLKTEFRERKANAEGSDPFTSLSSSMIEDDTAGAIVEVGRNLRATHSDDPYRVLASLPIKVYVTTGWTDLLQAALREDENKSPVTMCFPWTPRAPWARADTSVLPSVEKPWVYHLFGRLENPTSLVLTEDDYFAWLTAWIDKRPELPELVRGSMSGSSLMFLGHQLEDWDFRVIFQSIKSFLGYPGVSDSDNVAVQLRPDNELIDPEAAQKYIQSYFRPDNVKIFWGTPQNFLTELQRRLKGGVR